jgi:hypothetical protein
MANSQNCLPPPPDPVTRPYWQAGSYLTASACSLEQNYLLQRFRRHNREMHGWGVLCGLWVVPGSDGAHPWGVKICPGFAIGPYGDEIELTQPAPVNVEDYLWFKPDPFSAIAVLPDIAYIVVRYQDWLDDLELIPGGACECKDPVYAEARTGDGYRAGAIWTPLAEPHPRAPQPGTPSRRNLPSAPASEICQPESPPCPPCPDSPWVTLARIVLPQRGVPITAAMIDNGFRTTL